MTLNRNTAFIVGVLAGVLVYWLYSQRDQLGGGGKP